MTVPQEEYDSALAASAIAQSAANWLERRHWRNPLYVITEHPIALDSIDHLEPHGTKNDNNTSAVLLDELAAYYTRPYSLLDIGCAGGQFIVDCSTRGNEAVGLEGSNYSIIHHQTNWSQYHNYNLFLCDVRRPFSILSGSSWKQFDVVTAWEVLEHFAPDEIESVLLNIHSHLKDDGMFLASISMSVDSHHKSSHLRWEDWLSRLEKWFNVEPYPFSASPREDCRKSSVFIKASKSTGQ